MPHYYRVPAVTKGDVIGPELPEDVVYWAGVHNDKTGNYIVRTEEPIEGYSDDKLTEDQLPAYARGLVEALLPAEVVDPEEP